MILSASFIVVGAIAWRYWQIKDYPIGIAYGFNSPDNKFEAAAVTMYDKRFVGPDYTWTKFEVSDAATQKTLFSKKFKDRRGSLETDEIIDHIKWSEDSTQVDYVYRSEVICTVKTAELPQ